MKIKSQFESKFRLVLAISVIGTLFVPCGDTQGDDSCKLPRIPKSPSAMEQCNASLPESCVSTMDMRDFYGMTIQCLKHVMNRELDQRLLPLKKSAPAQFKAEMKTQAAFNRAVDEECGRYLKCDGSAAILNADGYDQGALEYRARQAQAVNAGQLELKTPKAPAKHPHWRAEFRTFAKGLCALPASVWKDRAVPSDCERRVLLDMEAGDLLLPQSEEALCGGEE